MTFLGRVLIALLCTYTPGHCWNTTINMYHARGLYVYPSTRILSRTASASKLHMCLCDHHRALDLALFAAGATLQPASCTFAKLYIASRVRT